MQICQSVNDTITLQLNGVSDWLAAIAILLLDQSNESCIRITSIMYNADTLMGLPTGDNKKHEINHGCPTMPSLFDHIKS